MTYSTTHLGLSTMVLLLVSPQSLKDELKSNPRFFFFLTLAAIAPDFDLIISEVTQYLPNFWIFLSMKDYFAGSHRVWSHSLFFPFTLMLIAPLFGRLFSQKKDLTRNIQLFGFIWFTHIIFDLTFGPLALFYPLDTRFYDVNFGIQVGLKGNWLVPVTLAGFYMHVSYEPQNIGSNTFFVNWTPQQRISTFGSNQIMIDITNFWSHVAIFAYYVIIVLLPYVKFEVTNIFHIFKKKGNQNGTLFQKIAFSISTVMMWVFLILKGLGNWIVTIPKRNKRWVVDISLFALIIVSFLGGPYYGNSWKQTGTQNETFWVLSDGIKLSSFKQISLGESSNFSMQVFQDYSAFPLKVFSVVVNSTVQTQFNDQYSTLVGEYDQGNITYLQFHQDYLNLMSAFVPLGSIRTVNENSTGIWNFIANHDLLVFSGIYSWNVSDYFIKSFRFDMEWTFSRTSDFRNGIILMFLFAIFLLISLVKPKIMSKKV